MGASMRPSLDHLDAVGAPLLLKFLSTPVGVHYLHESRFIESELEDWFLQRNVLYVIEVELALQAAFSPEGSTTSSFDGSIPAHFYGELARTSEGCEILAQTGHFKQFIDYIEEHGLEADDQDILLKLKSALWVVVSCASRALPRRGSRRCSGACRLAHGRSCFRGGGRRASIDRRSRRGLSSVLHQRVRASSFLLRTTEGSWLMGTLPARLFLSST